MLIILTDLSIQLIRIFRRVYVLRLLRYLIGTFGTLRPLSKLAYLFDPNFLRKKSQKSLKRTHILSRGVYGENLILDLSEHIDYRTFMNGYFDITCSEYFAQNTFSENSLFIDIGANVGSVSIAVAKQGLRVVSIEPVEGIFKKLVENIRINPELSIVPIMTALTSGEPEEISGFITLYQPKGNSGATSSNRDWNPSASDSLLHKVPATSLDSLISSKLLLKGIDNLFLKIDAEGMELEILQGAKDSINNYNPTIFLEWRPDRLSEIQRLKFIDWILKLKDYSIYSISVKQNSRTLEIGEFYSLASYENIVLVSNI